MKAVARPNAHVHILGIAAHGLALVGHDDEARAVAASIHARLPDYRLASLLAAFHLREDAAALLRQVAPRIGMG